MLDRNSLENFRTLLRGPVLLPGEPGYDEARAIWNAIIDHWPALIARCLGVADVMTGVNFAREHGLTLSIKGGGHNISGLAVCDGGLMLGYVADARRLGRPKGAHGPRSMRLPLG